MKDHRIDFLSSYGDEADGRNGHDDVWHPECQDWPECSGLGEIGCGAKDDVVDEEYQKRDRNSGGFTRSATSDAEGRADQSQNEAGKRDGNSLVQLGFN